MAPTCSPGASSESKARRVATQASNHTCPRVDESAPGVQCRTCKAAGREQWVLPGRCCPVCGTPAM
ncbi:uncharacterized protein BCR38DRAFT_426617 [Pseudomassariella vexata]|uniref:Uncharacterized protein n=1 Tax=Pseudomassariella vexata TaxID=1141098 RepID=A0A1Y2E6V9_9PEZI|nr:uncharacterized protein BCR38DRAFT_426617 [Pseudomassariella vexata]ORY67298.1 hypothetical protein BCR38DRAFT_426617 [Pseudomassariella vexata]